MKDMNALKGKEEEVPMMSDQISYHHEGSPLDLSTTNNPSSDTPVEMVEIDLNHSDDATNEDSDRCDDRDDRAMDEMGYRPTSTNQQNEDEFQFAGMNINTNGIMSDVDMEKANQDSSFLEDMSMKKIKQINIGEIPLEPMGLSLSGSGMQLFVKLNSDLRKTLVSNNYAKKPRIRRMTTTPIVTRSKKNVKDCTLAKKEKEIPGLGNALRCNEDNNRQFCNANETLLSTDKHSKDIPCEENSTCQHYTLDNLHNMAYPTVTGNQFKLGQTVERNHPGHIRIQIDNKSGGNDDSCLIPKPVIWKGNSPKSSSIAKDNTSSRPRWIEGKADDRTASHHNKDREYPPGESLDKSNQAYVDQPWFSSTFKSSDLPLAKPKDRSKKLYHSPGQLTQKYRRGHCKRCVHPSRYPSHRRSPSRSRSNSSSSMEDDDEFLDEREGSYSDVEPVRKSSFRVRERMRESERCKRRRSGGLRSGDIVSPDKPGYRRSEHSNIDSSVGPTFDITRLTPQTMDSETLNKFTEYTQDMRKDLKRRYKDLSRLLQEFNQHVREKNGYNHTETNEADDRRVLDKRCVVM